MRLIKNIIEEALKEYQEGTLNKEFNPVKYYSIIQLSIAYLEATIQYKDGISKDRQKHLNKLYNQYIISQIHNNKTQEQKYRQALETEMIKDTKHIHTLFQILSTQNIEEELRTELYNPKKIGYLSYELST